MSKFGFQENRWKKLRQRLCMMPLPTIFTCQQTFWTWSSLNLQKVEVWTGMESMDRINLSIILSHRFRGGAVMPPSLSPIKLTKHILCSSTSNVCSQTFNPLPILLIYHDCTCTQLGPKWSTRTWPRFHLPPNT